MKMNKAIYCLIFFLSYQLSAEEIRDDVGDFQIKKADFKSIFNEYRFSQAHPLPWAGSFWAYAENGIDVPLIYPEGKSSPAQKYDDFFGLGGEAVQWERENHSCKNVDSDLRRGCKEWWGHCNAWSAAAVIESEPLETVINDGVSFYVPDQKAYLSELWMESGSLFSGSTQKEEKTKKWIFSSSSETSKLKDPFTGRSYFDAFWDISPKTFFLILTNYLGIQKTGVIIDRFTGEEVWNQPVAGYRILPLRDQDILPPVIRGDNQIYPVTVRIKIYWATDHVSYQGKEFRHVSRVFDIEKTKDTETVEEYPARSESPDYTGRFLSFQLYFDGPVVFQSESKTRHGFTQIESIGRMVGYGIWSHQELGEVGELHTADLDHTHPDFIWKPTTLEKWADPYGNPHFTQDKVEALFSGNAKSVGEVLSQQRMKVGTQYSLSLVLGFSGLSNPTNAESVKRKVKFILNREDIENTIFLSDINIKKSKKEVSIFVKKITVDDVNLLREVFEVAELDIKSIQLTTSE